MTKTTLKKKAALTKAVKKKAAPQKKVASKKKIAKTTPIKKKSVVKKSVAKKPVAKKSTAKKTPVKKKPTAKKPVAKKATVKKTPIKKKSTVKKSVAKKPAAKKALVKKKSTAKKPTNNKSAVDKASKQKSASKRGARLIVHKERTKRQSKKNKSMTQEKLQYFRSLLLKWKEDLMQEVDKTVLHMRNNTTQLADPADRATKEEEFNFELKTRNRERKLIQKIDNALENIAKNKYGYCISCGAAIGFKRLQVRPTALVCIDCKTLQESQEKQTLFN